jgi:D-3-phosphoglycerate dehydrogenase / 2-oxoglutarate reductase
LMLAMMRELPRADAGMKAGKWLKKEMEGNELFHKTLGIIGCGRIGSAVAQRAAAFGMAVIGYDALTPAEEMRKQGIEPVTLDQLYTRADVITIHTPLTNDTRDLIGAGELAKMKPGVRLICTARGNIIDETALLAALESGHAAGAALDVFSIEPPVQAALVSHPHLIATPHIGAQTIEAQQRAAMDIAGEVLAALRGEPLRWKVA